MEFGIIGTSIWQQNMPLLERLTVDRDSKIETIQKLKEILGLEELIYLSTCNRVEFIFVKPRHISNNTILHKMIDFFFKDNTTISFFPNDFFTYSGKEAISHLFRMTSSLESLVVGETQISSQFKTAYEEAQVAGWCGPMLNSLAKEALMIAKRVKKETTISDGSVSMASLATNELKNTLAKIEAPKVAIVGSGEMSVKMAKYIRDIFNGQIVFVNRTLAKAEKLASEYKCESIALDKFLDSPIEIDAIITATAAVGSVFDFEFLKKLQKMNKQIVCIDLAIPRDFSFDFNGAENITLIDIPFLKSKAQSNLRQKFVEASRADEIVRDAVLQYLSYRIEVSLKPIFNESYKESMDFARKAYDNLFSHRMQSLPEEEKEAVFELISKVIGYSSFQPVKMLSNRFVEMRSNIDLAEIASIRKEAI
ncbi:MAG: glutamyl-tRNA reductase [candidate division Zixibacteria bacterium]|nr:glutamyl-tRNA reductase [candidate division Zixibacteria bacterium]